MKFILVLRQPYEAPISLLLMWHRTTKAWANVTVENRLFWPNETLKESHYLLDYGKFDENFKMWLQYFNRSQIKVFDSEILKTNPLSVLTEIEDFVGLPNEFKQRRLVEIDKERRILHLDLPN